MIRDAIELIREGGLQVITLLSEEKNTTLSPSSASDQYQGKVFDQQGIRTLIQLDSDYVTILSPGVLSMPELLKRHGEAVNEKLGKFQQLQSYILHSCMLFLIVFSLFMYGIVEEWWVVALGLMGSYGIKYARHWLARITMRLLFRVARRYV